jgi:hypothetical protein
MTRNKLADCNLTLIFSIKLDGPNLSWFLLPEEWRHFSWWPSRYLLQTQVICNGEIVSCDCAAPFTFDAINNFQHSKFLPAKFEIFLREWIFLFFTHVRRWGDWQSERVSLLIWNTTDSFRWKITDRLVCTHLKESRERKRIFSTTLLCVETGMWILFSQPSQLFCCTMYIHHQPKWMFE